MPFGKLLGVLRDRLRLWQSSGSRERCTRWTYAPSNGTRMKTRHLRSALGGTLDAPVGTASAFDVWGIDRGAASQRGLTPASGDGSRGIHSSGVYPRRPLHSHDEKRGIRVIPGVVSFE